MQADLITQLPHLRTAPLPVRLRHGYAGLLDSNGERVATAGSDLRHGGNAIAILVGAAAGAALGGAVGLLTGMWLLTIPSLSPVVAAGWFVVAIAGVIAGSLAGGIGGALIEAATMAAHSSPARQRRGSIVLTAQAIAPPGQSRPVLIKSRPVHAARSQQDRMGRSWNNDAPTNSTDLLPSVSALSSELRSPL